jgi:hypothetical protein
MKHAGTTALALIAALALASPVRTASLAVAAPGNGAAPVSASASSATLTPSSAVLGTPAVHVQTQSLRQVPATSTGLMSAGPKSTVSKSTVSKSAVSKSTVSSSARTSARPVATLSSTRTAYLKAMYLSVVPARQRAVLAGRYVLGYALPGMACGTGCSGLFNGQARSSFSAAFFTQPVAYQRNILAHEAAHAYGFLFIAHYTTSSWAGVGGWQAQFHRLDRSFAGTYDAEAWASCVAWKQTGFNNRVLQIARVCTPQAAALAMQHLS